jgi:methylthioribose-1-phosphate isomerase
VTAEAPPAAVGPAPPAGADLDRRRFFRQFAGDIFHTAATVVGAATALQRSSAEAAGAILNGPARIEEAAAAAEREAAAQRAAAVAAPTVAGAPPPGIATAPVSGSTFGRPLPAVGYHSAFRVDDDRIVLIDQRRLPFALVEVDCRTGIEVGREIADRTIAGPAAVAQVAALGLAQSANRVRDSRPYARRAILRATQSTLLSARPTSRPLRAAVERVMARCEAIGEFDEDGDAIADAMQQEADAIVFEANDDHGRLAEAAATRIPRRTDRATGVLTLGSTGAMGGGQFGTALGAIQAATYAERDVHVFVLEGRPTLDGARVVVWELAQAGIPHTLIADAAVGSLLQSGRIDVVLVGAEAIALNGDVANDVGTYPVAALAGRHGVPFVVCAPLATLDPAAADGRALVAADGPARDVLEMGKAALTLPETQALNPVVDITPAGLVTAFATEEGLLEPSFPAAFERALANRALRLPRSLAGATVIPGAPTAPATAGAPTAGSDSP